MSRLTENNNKKSDKPKSKLINRGAAIVPETKFSMDELPNNTVQSVDSETESLTDIWKYEPVPTTLKIDTQLRDQTNALSLIGIGETQKDVIRIALAQLIDGLPAEEQRKYALQFDVLQDKTIKGLKKKG